MQGSRRSSLNAQKLRDAGGDGARPLRVLLARLDRRVGAALLVRGPELFVLCLWPVRDPTPETSNVEGVAPVFQGELNRAAQGHVHTALPW